MKVMAVIALLAMCCSFPATVSCAGLIEGIITDLGFGAFDVTAENGTELRLHESGKVTEYEPENWRPNAGDEVLANYSEEYRHDRTVLIANKVKMLKAGPDTYLLTSPLIAIIEEAGRSGYRAKIPSCGNQIRKFISTRDTIVTPSEWTPAPGDQAVISFETEPARFGFGLSFIVNEIEKK